MRVISHRVTNAISSVEPLKMEQREMIITKPFNRANRNNSSVDFLKSVIGVNYFNK